MNSKNCQLMLLAGALTVSFVAKAAEDNKPVAGDVLPVAIEKNTDANVYGHVINKSSGEHLPWLTRQSPWQG